MTVKSESLVRSNVDSSNISAYAYDHVTQKFTVEFKNSGAVYVYSNVPWETVAGLENAESKGKYFTESIRGEYDSVQLETD